MIMMLLLLNGMIVGPAFLGCYAAWCESDKRKMGFYTHMASDIIARLIRKKFGMIFGTTILAMLCTEFWFIAILLLEWKSKDLCRRIHKAHEKEEP